MTGVDNSTSRVQTVSLLAVMSGPNTLGTSPVDDGNGEPEEQDITDIGSNRTILGASSLEDIVESPVESAASEVISAEISHAAVPRISTVELNHMEQGSDTNVVRRRTTSRDATAVRSGYCNLTMLTKACEGSGYYIGHRTPRFTWSHCGCGEAVADESPPEVAFSNCLADGIFAIHQLGSTI
jgi:hypothetical protein